MWICVFSGIVACKQAKTLVSEVINVYLAEVSNVRLHTVACYFSLFSKRCSFPYTKMMLMHEGAYRKPPSHCASVLAWQAMADESKQ